MDRISSRGLSRTARATLALACAACAALPARGTERFVFLTNWYAEAEHGGFYQALATGLYERHGLDVHIGMGGPQVNIVQLVAAGQADCVMGSNDLQAVIARAHGVPLVTVAAIFQKDPEALIAHEDVKSFADMKSRTILISSAARQGSWPWLKAKYGFRDTQARPYTSNLQAFAADRSLVQEGYITSEPFALEQAGIRTRTFLLGDFGYTAYSTTIVCMESTLAGRHAAVAAFVRASIEGWKSYIADPAQGNALIRRDNPNMSEAQLAYSVRQIRERGMVASGDAAKQGIGTMNPARLKASFDFLVGAGLVDPAQVDFERTFTTEFVHDVKVLP